MQLRPARSRAVLASCGACAAIVGLACSEPRAEPSSDDATTSEGAATSTDETSVETTSSEKLDVGGDSGGPMGCQGDGDCRALDLLFVIDNSGTMGEEQRNLAKNFGLLVEGLEDLKDANGDRIAVDVNIMITTTDLGHPLCDEFQPDGYTPARGAPIFTGCNQRIDAFDGVAPVGALHVPEVCTEVCPMDIVPGGAPFIHFDAMGSNVLMNDVEGALSCIAPQGINGCGYEAPLEAMMQALQPDACWNSPDAEHCADTEWSWVTQGFMRSGATLAVAVITDETDCSVAAPNGYLGFIDPAQTEYWNVDPLHGVPTPSSAICWNSGVECADDDEDGVFESCVSVDNGVLTPVSRYVEFLDWLDASYGKQTIFLGILGVPPVTKHRDEPPFDPIEGGLAALEYREWRDEDVLPAEWELGARAEHKTWEFGIGPGCTVVDETTGFVAQAQPSTRIVDVCESRNYTDEHGDEHIRCCIESICGDDFSGALGCLTDIIQAEVVPEG